MYGIIIIYKLSMHPSSHKGEKMNDWRQSVFVYQQYS